MNGVELRVVALRNRDTDLGTENADTENSGAIELWRDGKRIVEFVWWEKPYLRLDSLEDHLELHTHLTYETGIHHGTAVLRRPS